MLGAVKGVDPPDTIVEIAKQLGNTLGVDAAVSVGTKICNC